MKTPLVTAPPHSQSARREFTLSVTVPFSSIVMVALLTGTWPANQKASRKSGSASEMKLNLLPMRTLRPSEMSKGPTRGIPLTTPCSQSPRERRLSMPAPTNTDHQRVRPRPKVASPASVTVGADADPDRPTTSGAATR